MKYLLDTCILSHFMRGHSVVLERIKNTPPTQIAVSTVTCMEIGYGLQLNPQRAIKHGVSLNLEPIQTSSACAECRPSVLFT